MLYISKELQAFTVDARTALETYKNQREQARLHFGILVKNLLTKHRDEILDAARSECKILISENADVEIDIGNILHTVIDRSLDPGELLSEKTLMKMEKISEDIFNSMRHILNIEFKENILHDS